ncbi:hypothetical protein AMAG_17840 [Allomyces macrogynus ATCC 38327]|uniref:Uncharacterized protein n=1 Tax=Allomyces macrogynus (strain ATCC 38327) TaxID=578462 RepID=A0A0L0S0G7_ALLM3|nr:hypothetical protein AMAG_17840 [Allomyces macrogynus ATCC 38327]|eukprot:KNE55910.1 hypothetical protein AMAG_17840 [Allomyces macrogynus ATCC 38327]
MAALIKLLRVLGYSKGAEHANDPALLPPPPPPLAPSTGPVMASEASPPTGASAPNTQQAILVAASSKSPRPPPPPQLVQTMQHQFLLPMMAGTVTARLVGWADPEAEERKRAVLEKCRYALENGVFPEGAGQHGVGMLP